MYVHMKNGVQRRWLTVHLRDGFSPCIGDQNSALSLPPVARMEPAIWCKVLVLKKIHIDCDERKVTWSTGSQEEDSDGPNSPNQYSMNEECSGYDTEDELFDLARTIIKNSENESWTSNDDYKMCTLRMLHCFVLPKVTLHKRDLGKVELAKAIQLQHIEELDAKIKDHCMKVDVNQEELEVKRESLLPTLEEMITNKECSKQFIKLLLEDVKQEECKIRKQMDCAQNDVENAKLQLEASKGANSIGQLYQARESRNFLHNKLELLVTSREVLFNTQNEIPDELELHESEVIADYVEKREAVQRLKNDRSQFIHCKNCALSVREMLDEILNDLNTHGFSVANDADIKGARATDVLQHAWYPEWQKLSERVATIVYNPDHPIGSSFDSFCSEISETCKAVIDLGKLNDNSLYQDTNRNHFGEQPNLIPEDQLGGSYQIFNLSDFMVESYRKKLNEIKRKIFCHFDKMTGLLSEQFGNQETLFQNKLRLAYEHCFYEKVHDFIECVYELAHHEHVENLEADIKRLKNLPIKLLKLPMKDEWWHEIFEQRVKIEELNSHVIKLENGFCSSDSEGSDDQMEDDLDGLDIQFPFNLNKRKEQLSDCISVRSFFISTVRERSRTFNRELLSDESDEEDAAISQRMPHSSSCGPHLSTSAPQNSKGKLSDMIEKWDDPDEKTTKDSIKRRHSKSYNELNCSNNSKSCTVELQKDDTFEDHFGPALQNMKDVFKTTSPVAKLKCLTASLSKIAVKVSELRSREGRDSFSAAVTAEDLLPLLVLMMLQLESFEAASLWPQLTLLEDLMAPFLTAGCHGWALVEFQMAQRILKDLCSEF